jgi:hypothetical protein
MSSFVIPLKYVKKPPIFTLFSPKITLNKVPLITVKLTVKIREKDEARAHKQIRAIIHAC